MLRSPVGIGNALEYQKHMTRSLNTFFFVGLSWETIWFYSPDCFILKLITSPILLSATVYKACLIEPSGQVLE